MNGFGRGFAALPPVVKNLILINVLLLVATLTAKSVFSFDLTNILALYFPKSEMFKPLQILTHMFMHADFWHLFFNMFALYMFGGILENVWGPKRFLVYYLICGLGAAFTHETVIAFQYNQLAQSIGPENLQMVIDEATTLFRQGQGFTDPEMLKLQMLLNTPTVGASGAVFGILLAFGVLIPKYPAYASLSPHSNQSEVFCSRLWCN